jgi:N-hydroxyarylamine O-acetyltransferase
MGFELGEYLERIGYAGPLAATAEVLAEVQLRHVQAIAFENLNSWLKRPVGLDIDSLVEKMVRGGQGGYCYEQNLLFGEALRELGFGVVGLAARVVWNAPPGVRRARTHMALRVEAGGEAFLCDVGFGGPTPTGPLRLEAGIAQRTPHERFRLMAAERELVLEVEIPGGWMPLYQFGETPQLLADYEVANWYVSTHPKSMFVTTLLAARPAAGVRYALRNNEFTAHRLDGKTERRMLRDADEVRAVLEEVFLVKTPEEAEFDERLRGSF